MMYIIRTQYAEGFYHTLPLTLEQWREALLIRLRAHPITIETFEVGVN